MQYSCLRVIHRFRVQELAQLSVRRYSTVRLVNTAHTVIQDTPTLLQGKRNRSVATLPIPNNLGRLVYSGPLTKAVKSIKIFSLATAFCAVTFTPILVWFGNSATPFVGRVAIASVVTTVGLTTTILLHWFIKSYVTNLFYNKANGNVTVETLSIFGRTRRTQFHVSKALPPDSVSAFSTFQAAGIHFFLHTELFQDPNLLRQLLGAYSVFEHDNINHTEANK